MIDYKRLRAAFGIGFCATVLPLCALAEGGEVGYIEQVPASKNSVLIIRMGEPIESKLFTPIRVGDRITITAEDTQLTIRLAGGDRIKVSASNSPFWVVEHSEKLSISKNVREWLAGLFGRLHKDVETYTVPMTTRGGDDYVEQARPPKLLFLTTKQPIRVSQDHRWLRVEWVYGVMPYEVRVVNLSIGREEFSASQITTKAKVKCTDFEVNPPVASEQYIFGITLKGQGLSPGKYRVLVADALGNVGSQVIDLVEDQALGAKWIEKGEINDLPQHLIPVVRVAALLETDSDELRYNARQLLGPLAEWDYPTQLLGNRLLCNTIASNPE